MNKEQLQFVHQPNTNGVLIGIPGGGKSTSIIRRIVYQVATKQIPPKGGYIVVTFSRAAANDFRQKGKSVDPNVFEDEYIRTIHSLAGVLTPRSAINSLNTVVYRATKSIELDASVVCQRYSNVKVIYVDEAQDISKTQYDLVCMIASALGAALVLVGDVDQALYAFQGGSSEFLQNHAGFRIELVQNYRSTHQIVSLANAARPTKKGVADMQSASNTHGMTPCIVSNRHDALVKRMMDIVHEAFAKGHLIAVIGSVKGSGYDSHGHMKNIGLQWAYHALYKNGVKLKSHYKESLREGNVHDTNKDKLLSKKRVHLFTIHGSKGLEFDTVILLNFHKELMGFSRITADDYASYKCLMYVGMTRAKSDLWIFHARHREVWSEYHSYSKFMRTEGDEIPPSQVDLIEVSPPKMYQWLDIITNRKLFSERHLSELEDLAAIDVATSGERFEYAHVQLPDEDVLSTLYGQWAENMFENRYRGKKPKCYRCVQAMLASTHIVNDKNIMYQISKIHKDIGLKTTDVLMQSDYEAYKEKHEVSSEVDEYVSDVLHCNDGKVFFAYPGMTRFFDSNALLQIIRECDKQRMISSELVWKLCLFIFQYEHEAKYRWYYNYDNHINALQPYEEYIRQTASSLADGYFFNIECMLDVGGKPLRGYADVVHYDQKEVIELKFTTSFTMTHGLQSVGYGVMLYPMVERVKLFNLRTHKKYDISSPLLDDTRGIKKFRSFLATSLKTGVASN